MRILREPLIHFLLLGAVVFAAHSLFFRDNEIKRDEIVVTQGKIENLITTFGRTWQRPPTQQELNGLIQDYIREEVAYREALALGLDRDDTIIRRRLRQKLEFISDSLATQAEPNDVELQAYLISHAEDYRNQPSFTFRQVYLDPQKHGANLKRDADKIILNLRKLNSTADLTNFSDSVLLESDFVNTSASDIKRIFGENFETAFSTLKIGEWQGPIESGYGLHLVLIMNRKEGSLPALEQVREAVKRDWANAKRMEESNRFYQTLLTRYKVVMEPEQVKKLSEMR